MLTADSKDFGWFVYSIDENQYGPVTKEVLLQWLAEGTVSLNTIVRHCTDAESRPLAEQEAILAEGETSRLRTGDHLNEHFPRRKRDAAKLAESQIECSRHSRPAVLTCIRCHAPFCSKCTMKRGRSTCYMCKKCQGGIYNRRTIAYLADTFVLYMLLGGIVVPLMLFAPSLGESAMASIINLTQLGGTLLFFLRDPLLGGAGPGKKLTGLKVVKQSDGVTPLTYGQGMMRMLSLMIPFFNLVDLSIPYRSPTQRRFGDSWAKTQVLDVPQKLEAARQKTQDRLLGKGIDFTVNNPMPLEEFARL
ncbi:MAG TPA: RDD family protein [Planctomicrobium sp.]|nr:RDD family protein [Planctomicrobium sp.]